MPQQKNTVHFVRYTVHHGINHEKEKYAFSDNPERLMRFIYKKSQQNSPWLFFQFSDILHLTCSCDAYDYLLSKLDKGIYTGGPSAYKMVMYMSKVV